MDVRVSGESKDVESTGNMSATLRVTRYGSWGGLGGGITPTFLSHRVTKISKCFMKFRA